MLIYIDMNYLIRFMFRIGFFDKSRLLFVKLIFFIFSDFKFIILVVEIEIFS